MPTPSLGSLRSSIGSMSCQSHLFRCDIDGATRVYLPNGRRGGPELLQAGYLVDVVYDPAGTVPVQSVKIIRRVS